MISIQADILIQAASEIPQDSHGSFSESLVGADVDDWVPQRVGCS